MKEIFGKLVTDEEYEKFIEGFRSHLQKDADYKKRRLDHVSKFIENLPEDQIDAWMDKFLKWEENYEDYCYHKLHVITCSEIFNGLTDYIEQNGKEIGPAKNDMFFGGGWKWKNYTFRVYVGQGSFWRVWRKRTVIFQTT